MSPVAPLRPLRTLIRSRRRRRRLVAISACLLVTGSVAAIVVIIGNTGKNLEEHFSSAPVQAYKEPPRGMLTAADRKRIHDVTMRFIGSAVARQHLGDSYDIVSPNLREGLTREAWLSGNIPVVPYNVESVIRFKLEYSFADDVAYDVVLVGRRGTFPAGKTFMIELRRFPKSKGAHAKDWFVESWVPQGISTDTPAAARAARTPPPKPESPISSLWLLVPAGILGLLVVIPVWLFTRNWYGARRSRRALAQQSAQTSRTSPS